MVNDHNATMTMEAWSPADNPGTSATGGEGITFSHPWCAGPGHAIPRFLMGVTPLERGWARASIRPQPGSLRLATIAQQTAVGTIHAGLTQTTTGIALVLALPPGLKAKVK